MQKRVPSHLNCIAWKYQDGLVVFQLEVCNELGLKDSVFEPATDCQQCHVLPFSKPKEELLRCIEVVIS